MNNRRIRQLIPIRRLGLVKPSVGFVSILLLQSLLVPLLPLPGKFILDRFQKSNEVEADTFFYQFFSGINQLPTMNLLVVCAALIVAMGLGLALLRFGEGMVAALINRRIFAHLRTQLSEQIVSRRMEFLNQKKKVDLMGRVSSDVEKVQQVYSGAFATLFKSIPTIILTIVAMLLTDVLITALFLISIPILYGVAFSITRYLKMHDRRLREATNRFQETLLQSYSNLSVSKSLQSEGQVLEQLDDSNQDLLKTFISSERVASLFYSTLIFIKALIRALVLLIGCYYIFLDRISFGDFFLFFAYLEALIFPIDEISRFSTKWSKTQVAMERVEQLLSEMKGYPELSGEQMPADPALSISLQKATFAYQAEDGNVIDDLSTQFRGPGIYAIVGASGQGKSTIFSLMNRLFSCQSGRVEFSGVNVQDWDLKALRRHVLLVDQANFLISGSILDNLRLALPQASHEQAWQALKKVNAHDFVKQLPNGLDTLVGEGGQGLSGGQSRRISLARSFLKIKASVYLFDEPTAGLDPDSAKVVMSSLKEKSESELVLFSTHRMDELDYADQVFVMDGQGQPHFASSAEVQRTNAHFLDLPKAPDS